MKRVTRKEEGNTGMGRGMRDGLDFELGFIQGVCIFAICLSQLPLGI